MHILPGKEFRSFPSRHKSENKQVVTPGKRGWGMQGLCTQNMNK